MSKRKKRGQVLEVHTNVDERKLLMQNVTKN